MNTGDRDGQVCGSVPCNGMQDISNQSAIYNLLYTVSYILFPTFYLLYPPAPSPGAARFFPGGVFRGVRRKVVNTG